ncbi:MAG: ATP-binding protein [Capsulimonadales bacterium]|nr:ATP-binding protein [Capsulimonadales bacterium]
MNKTTLRPHETDAQNPQDTRVLQATLDALPAHVAILDEQGRILAVNRAWKQFMREYGGDPRTCGIGANYLDACEASTGADTVGGRTVAQGLRDTIHGRIPEFLYEYPCPTNVPRWFFLRITRFEGAEPARILVSHEDITVRKLAELDREAARARLRHAMGQANCLLWEADVSEVRPDGVCRMRFDDERGTELHWELTVINRAEEDVPSWLPLKRERGISVGLALQQARHPDDEIAAGQTARTALLEGKRRYSQTFRIRMEDGTWRHLFEDVRIEALPPETESGDAPTGRWHLVGVVTDITERKLAEDALQAAHDELEERVARRTRELAEASRQAEVARAEAEVARAEAETANQAKSEFLSRMSHELRTPLNAILGFGQILQRQTLTPLQQESVDYILSGGRHLLDLINEILDISRVDAGRIGLATEPIVLLPLITEAWEMVRPQAEKRDIYWVEPALADRELRVLADRQRLKQVLINLLSNAVKYNRDGGAVSVAAEALDETRVRVAVRDTGIGIPESQMARLFTPFERLDAIRTEIEGTGLGLALSRSLVTAMGGSMTVESTVGVGSVFIAELPRMVDRLNTGDTGDTGDTSETVSGDRRGNVRSETTADVVPDASSSRHTVLCIEDQASNLTLLEAIFEMRPNVRLLEARQGLLGLELAERHRPDLILLDLHLPDISGEETLAHLQRSETVRDIPVVIVSADALPGRIERLLAQGARAYLTKPLDVVRFLETIDPLLASPKEK